MNIVKLNRFIKQSYLLQTTINKYQQYNNTTGYVNFSTKVATYQKADWNRAVSEAEKIVGYPTSFFNLRWILSDEVANVALHLRKLVGSNHPLLKTAKTLFYNQKSNTKTWGLIVLLVSKAGGHGPDVPFLEQEKAAGVLHNQRALAEIVEMIATSYVIHKSLVNIQTNVDNDSDILFGNKISLLSGDYLLCTSCVELANLKQPDLVGLMSAAIRDQSEAEFVGPRDLQNFPLPAPPRQLRRPVPTLGDSSLEPIIVLDTLGDASAEWTLRNMLATGTLLGKACLGTLKLAGVPQELQEQGYLFGKHLALAWQASIDRAIFQDPPTDSFSLISAPVLFQLEHDSSLYSEIEKGMKSIFDVNFKLIRDAVLSGPGIEKTRQLEKEHSQIALDVLQKFPNSDAKTALSNIIVAMQEL